MNYKGRNQLIQRMKKRNMQMAYILENFTEPEFIDIGSKTSFDSLSSTFNMDSNGTEDFFNKVGITYRLINLNYRDEYPTYCTVATFMNNIQSYLPARLRLAIRGSYSNLVEYTKPLWNYHNFSSYNGQVGCSAETQELLDAMVIWINTMKRKIEDKITEKYYSGNKMQHLEILKRRFKADWSEKIENSIDANVNAEVDSTINITFEDA